MNMKIRRGLMMLYFGSSAMVNADCVINGNNIECTDLDPNGIPDMVYENYNLHVMQNAVVVNVNILGQSPFSKFVGSKIVIDMNAIIGLDDLADNDKVDVFVLDAGNWLVNSGEVLSPKNSTHNNIFAMGNDNLVVNDVGGLIEAKGIAANVYDISGNKNVAVNRGTINVLNDHSILFLAAGVDNNNAFINDVSGEIYLQGSNIKVVGILNGKMTHFSNAGVINLQGIWGTVFYYAGDNANSNYEDDYGPAGMVQYHLKGGIYNTGKITLDGKLGNVFFINGNQNAFYNFKDGLIQTTANSGENNLVYLIGNENTLYNDAVMTINSGKNGLAKNSIIFNVLGEKNVVSNEGSLFVATEDGVAVYLNGNDNQFINFNNGEIQLDGMNSAGIISIKNNFIHDNTYIENANLIRSLSSNTILIATNHGNHVLNTGDLQTFTQGNDMDIAVIFDGSEMGNDITNAGNILMSGGNNLYGIVANQNNYIANKGKIEVSGDHSQAIQLHFDEKTKKLVDTIDPFTFTTIENSGGFNVVFNDAGALIALGQDDPNQESFAGVHAIYGLGEGNYISNIGTIFINGKSDQNGNKSGAILLAAGEADTGDNNWVINGKTGVIKAIGPETFGISLQGSTDLSVLNSGKILVLGENTQAVHMETNHDSIIHNLATGFISAEGLAATAVSLHANEKILLLNEGIIQVVGEKTQAVDFEASTHSEILNDETAIIVATGNQAIAVNVVTDSKFSVANNGVIEVVGEEGKALSVNAKNVSWVFNYSQGKISAVGANATAIEFNADQHLYLENNGAIAASGEAVKAVAMLGNNALLVNNLDGLISAEGTFAIAVNMQGSNDLMIENAGIILATGDAAKSVYMHAAENMQLNNHSQGTLSAEGNNAVAVELHGTINLSVLNAGSISATGEHVKGVVMTIDQHAEIENVGLINVNGNNASAIDMEGSANLFVKNYHEITAFGSQSQAISMTSNQDSTILNTGLIAAKDNEGVAINWTNSSAASTNLLLNDTDGVIDGSGFSLLGSDGNEQIINFGLIRGNIDLQGGDDYAFLATYADIDAEVIDGGEGYDTFVLAGIDTSFERAFSLDDLVGFEKISIGCDEQGNLILNNQMLWVISGTGHLENSYLMSGKMGLAGDVTVTGDYEHYVETTFYIDIYEEGNSETLFVGGTAVIQGGHLVLVPHVLLPEKSGMEWIIISAQEVIGEFDSVNQLFALVDIVQENTGTELKVVTKQVKAFADPFELNLTPNQAAVAKSFDEMVSLGVDPNSEIYDFLVTLQNTGLDVYQRYLDQFHGEVYQNILQSGVELRQQQLVGDQDRLSSQLTRCSQSDCESNFQIFVEGEAVISDRNDFNDEFARFESERDGVTVGTVGSFGSAHLGIKADYHETAFQDYQNSHGGKAAADMTTIGGSVFGAVPMNIGIDLSIRGSVDVARHDLNVERTFDLMGETRRITGETNAWSYGGNFEVAHVVMRGESFSVEISGGMDYVNYQVDELTESGGGDANLHIDSYDDDQARAIASTRIGFTEFHFGALMLQPSIKVQYAYTLTDAQSHEQCFANTTTHNVCFDNYVVFPKQSGEIDLGVIGRIGGFSFGVHGSTNRSFADGDANQYAIQGEVGYRF